MFTKGLNECKTLNKPVHTRLEQYITPVYKDVVHRKEFAGKFLIAQPSDRALGWERGEGKRAGYVFTILLCYS